MTTTTKKCKCGKPGRYGGMCIDCYDSARRKLDERWITWLERHKEIPDTSFVERKKK